MRPSLALVSLLALAAAGATPAHVRAGEDAPPTREREDPPRRPLTRARLVGELELPTTGAPELVHLCANGWYVEQLVCGGFTRGRWRLDDDGVTLLAKQVCPLLGVKGTELGSATAECVAYRRYRFTGCLAPSEARPVVDDAGISISRDERTLFADHLEAMFAGRPPPGEDGAHWTWLHRKKPDPRACDPAWRPRRLADVRAGIRAR
jgi:hypothetical protein